MFYRALHRSVQSLHYCKVDRQAPAQTAKGGLKRLRKASDGSITASDAKKARVEAATAAQLMDDDVEDGRGVADGGTTAATANGAVPEVSATSLLRFSVPA